MSNPQWYERFNMEVDVSELIGMTRQHKALLEYVAHEAHSLDFYACMEKQKSAVHMYAKELYLP